MMKRVVLLLALVAMLLAAGAAAADLREDGGSVSASGSDAAEESSTIDVSSGGSADEDGSESDDAAASSDSGDAPEPSGVDDDDSSDSSAGSGDEEREGEDDDQPERTGIENFVMQMRIRLEADQKEAKEAWARESKALNASIDERAKVVTVAQSRLASANTEYEKTRILLADANRELRVLNGDIARAAVDLESAKQTREQSKLHWDQKIQLLKGNRDSSIDSVKLIERIAKIVDAPRPEESIAEILEERRDAVREGEGKLPAKEVELAVEAAKAAASSGMKPAQVSEFRDQLKRLKDQLMDHLEKLNEDIVTSETGMRDHLNRQDAEISELADKVSQLRDNLKANTEALPPLHTRLNETRTALGPAARAAHSATVAHAAEVADYEFEHSAFVRQQAMRDHRQRLITLLNQVVQEQLKSKNPRVVHRLRSIHDLLPVVPRNTSVSLPQVHYVTDTRGLSALEMEADMCGNWKFDENSGDTFAIDSSRHAQDGKLHGENLKRVNGSSGGALSFDGMNDYVDVGRVGDFGSEMGNFTVSFWVRSVDRHAGFASMLKTIGDGTGMAMGVDANRRVGRPNGDGVWPTGVQSGDELAYEPGATLFYLRDSRGRVLAGHINADVYDGKWHHLQWSVFSAPNNNMAAYVDGKHVPFVATVEQGPARFRNFDANLFLGAADVRGTPMGFFDGALDNVQLFCSGQKPVFGQKCCRICTVGKACGNDCIARNATCARDGGCACDRVDLEEVEKPKASGAGLNTTESSSASGSESSGAEAPAQQQQAAAQQQQAEKPQQQQQAEKPQQQQAEKPQQQQAEKPQQQQAEKPQQQQAEKPQQQQAQGPQQQAAQAEQKPQQQ